MTETTIDRVEVWHSSLPLPRPLVLGSQTIHARDFATVRIRTRGGVDGVAFALSRGGPTDVVVSECLGPLILGMDAIKIDAVRERCANAMIMLGGTGIALRAWSLLDISLWDIKAKVAGVPLWQMLGGRRREIPVMLIAPYAEPGESDVDYAARLLAETAGFNAIKLYPAADARATTSRVKAIREALAPEVALVLDMAWSWRSLREGMAAATEWADFGLRWIEDPFPPDRTDLTGALRAAISIPVAAGDEVSAPWLVESLLDGRVDVLRLDAAAIGGISSFESIASRASMLGCPISPHAYPEIHQHCAFAWPAVAGVEVYPSNSPGWLGDRLIRNPVVSRLKGATIEAPDLPGLGLEMDWQTVAQYAVRYGVIS